MMSEVAGIMPQAMDTTAPVTIPAIAPVALRRFQYSESRTSGPNAEPKPAQAKPTRPKMESDGLMASTVASNAITSTAPRQRLIRVLSGKFFLIIIFHRFSRSVEDTISSWEDLVDIIAAS